MSTIRKTSDGNLSKFNTGTEVLSTDIRAITQRVDKEHNTSGIQLDIGRKSSLTQLLHPSEDGGWGDIYKSGWKPAFFNQQWGGAQWGQLPDGSWGDIATGSITNNSVLNLVNSAGNEKMGQGFKVSEAIQVDHIWINVHKIINPVNNLQLSIWDDSAGDPNALITNGTATSQSGKLHTSNLNGEWVKFIFPTSPSLLANMQYHIVLSSSGAFSTSDHWQLRVNTSKVYPFGNLTNGTSAPVWTPTTTSTIGFLVVASVSSQFLQKSGDFDAKLVCAEGTPLNQSKGLTQPLKNFFDQKEFTSLIRGSAFTKDKTFMDFTYGFDHDRIVVRSNITTGFAQVDLFDSNGTKSTITGTTDISVGAHDIAVRARMKGDGSDYLYLYVNGVLEGTSLVNQTFTMDDNFKELGTAWVGGGFPLPPTWTGTDNFAGWNIATDAGSHTGGGTNTPTWTYGGGTEADQFSIQNTDRLYQNKNGFTSLQQGYYQTTDTKSNVTGWVCTFRATLRENSNSFIDRGCEIRLRDGTKEIFISLQEYFLHKEDGGSVNLAYQSQMKGISHVITVYGKGSDFYVYLDGLLVMDGTGLLLASATGVNQVFFGDVDVDIGIQADVIYEYIRYYEGWTPPEFSSCIIDEFGLWSGDKSVLLPILYNSGTRISIKDLAGIKDNYVDLDKLIAKVTGVSGTITTTSTTFSLMTDMEMFILVPKSQVKIGHSSMTSNATALTVIVPVVDGVLDTNDWTSSKLNGSAVPSNQRVKKLSTGLHKIETHYRSTTGGTTSQSDGNRRETIVEVIDD